jgi:hypothetical protein
MAQISHRRVGPNDHLYKAAGRGFSMAGTVKEHGYEVSLSAKIKFAAVGDKQANSIWELLHRLVDEVQRQSNELRRDNMPMFDMPETSNAPQGINER